MTKTTPEAHEAESDTAKEARGENMNTRAISCRFRRRDREESSEVPRSVHESVLLALRDAPFYARTPSPHEKPQEEQDSTLSG